MTLCRRKKKIRRRNFSVQLLIEVFQVNLLFDFFGIFFAKGCANPSRNVPGRVVSPLSYGYVALGNNAMPDDRITHSKAGFAHTLRASP